MLKPSNVSMLQSPKFSSLGNLYRLREHLPYGKSTPPNLPSPPSHPTSYFRQRQQRPQKNESRCLQYVMPGLFMAFEDDNISFGTSMNSRLPAEEELRTPDGQTFTHIIKLTTSKNPSGSPDITYTVDSHKTQVLNLDVFSNSHNLFELRMRILASETDCDGLSPEVARRLYTEYGDISEPYEGIPLLTPRQLLASREFMCATGYDLRRRQGAQILITAPRDHCTDIVSVLVCYLAYASRNTVPMVLLEIDKHPEFLGIWKNTVSGHGVLMIQDVVNVRS
ncbi:hypothetical protein DFH05DRAFT_1462005 [Lentinula detonsa]|uniref:Uncharacterized protein n=1 Tax=Lentinula detonsa TaxID=2804962 RepID=A0A9W8NW44_9AGAR|nr:hypothetical protein DFH05DRAFT_1462005 [Lentinula detonsa]